MAAQQVILHGTDFSACSARAFEVACCLARDRNAELLVLHVAPRPITTFGGVESVPPGPAEFDLATCKKHLAEIKAPEGIRMQTRLEIGEAAPTIISVARDSHCDLIVLGTHGRTGVNRLVMGSVAEKVVRGAPCPVLTLRAELPAK